MACKCGGGDGTSKCGDMACKCGAQASAVIWRASAGQRAERGSCMQHAASSPDDSIPEGSRSVHAGSTGRIAMPASTDITPIPGRYTSLHEVDIFVYFLFVDNLEQSTA